MTGVTRTCRCPDCGLPFLITFDSAHRLGERLVRIGCPRSCPGFIRTHVPGEYQIVPAEKRPSSAAPPAKAFPTHRNA